jgi:hypothetical protein
LTSIPASTLAVNPLAFVTVGESCVNVVLAAE